LDDSIGHEEESGATADISVWLDDKFRIVEKQDDDDSVIKVEYDA